MGRRRGVYAYINSPESRLDSSGKFLEAKPFSLTPSLSLAALRPPLMRKEVELDVAGRSARAGAVDGRTVAERVAREVVSTRLEGESQVDRTASGTRVGDE